MSEFVGKEATVRFEVSETVSYSGEVVADDERGITLRRPYRKGVRLELIPREQIRNVFVTEAKGRRKKVTKPEETEVEDDFEEDTEEDTDEFDLDDDPEFDDD